MNPRSVRVVAACLWAAIVVACGGGSVDPTPNNEVIAISRVTPENGASVVQANCASVSDCSRAVVEFSADARSSVGNSVTIRFKLDGKEVGRSSEVGYGIHTLSVSVRGVTAVKDTSVNFTLIPASPITVECVSRIIGGVSLDCSALRAYAVKGNTKDSAEFVGNLAKIVPRLRLLPDTGRVQLVVDFKDTTRRTHFARDPFVSKDSLSVVQKVILIPMKYTIPDGRWIMRVVNVDLITAFSPPINLDGSFGLPYFASSEGPYGLQNSRYYNTWSAPLDKTPFLVAFDHQNSNFVLDSIARWNYIRELEDEIGVQFAAPSSIEEARSSGKYNILIVADSNVSVDHVQMYVNESYCKVYFSKVVDALQEKNIRYVTKHEFLHCLGAGHVPYPPYGPRGWWPSLMSVSQNFSDSLVGIAVPEDVAHNRLVFDILSIEKEVGAKCSIAYAHQWSRVRAGLVRETPFCAPPQN